MKRRRKTKSRGAKPLDIAERLRVALWYLALHSRGWSDYELGQKFQPKPTRSLGAERQRTFETIRKRQTRPPKVLVTRVNRHPDFRGTGRLYTSLYWRLLVDWDMTLDEVSKLVDKSCRQFGLRRLSGLRSWLYRDQVVRLAGVPKDKPIAFDAFAKEMTRRSLENRKADLDLLTLLGALYKEALMAGESRMANVYKNEYVRVLYEFCEEGWLRAIATELREVAMDRVLHWHNLRGRGKRAPAVYPWGRISGLLVREDDPIAARLGAKEKHLLGHLKNR